MKVILAHFSYGVATALASVAHPVLSVLMFLAFMLYEFDQEWKLKDAAYEELREYGAGLGVGALALVALKLLG